MGRFTQKHSRLVAVSGCGAGFCWRGDRVLHVDGLGYRFGHGRHEFGAYDSRDDPVDALPGTSSAVTFTVDNPSSGHQQVGTIHLASINACPSGDTWNGTACSNGGIEITSCESVETGASDTNTANFWMPDVVSNQDLPTGNGQAITASGTLTMNDLNSSQNTCKNTNLTLNSTS